MGLFGKKKKDISISPFDLDWGEVTPDLISSEKSEYTNISNHYLINDLGRELSPIFTAGRITWYSKHIPSEYKPLVLLDIRGQDEIKFNTELKKNWGKGTRDRIENTVNGIELTINLLL
jgi:hypothetical protein